MSIGILLLSKETPGDIRFSSRWERVGEVFTSLSLPKEKREMVQAVVVDHHTTGLTAQKLLKFPNLKFIVSANTNISHVIPLVRPGLKVLYLSNQAFLETVHSVSEFTLGLILRSLRPLDNYGRLLRGKKVSIIGYGRIGKQLEALLIPFQCEIRTIDKDSKRSDWIQAFSDAHIVTIHITSNAVTKGIVSDDLLKFMRKDAILINTSRDEVVNNPKILGSRYVSDFPNHVAGATLEDRIRTDEFMVMRLSVELSR